MKIAFKKTDSLFHTLHPVSQVLFCATIFVMPLLNSNPFASMSAVLSVAVLAASSGVFKEWISWWRFCLFILILSVVVNAAVSSNGSSVLFKVSGIPIMGRIAVTAEGVCFGASMGLRISAIILVFAFATLAIDPDRILKLISPGSSASALLTAMALRMVPSVAKDSKELLEAQVARGLDLDSGNYIKRIRKRIPLLRKVTRTFLDRGISIAEAMESRAYGSGPRSKMRKYRFYFYDFAVIFILAVAFLYICVISALGFNSFDFYPRLSLETRPAGYAGFALLLFISTAFGVMSALWKKSDWLKLRI